MSPKRGPSPMNSRTSLWHGTSTNGPVGGAHRRSPRSARARVLRGILVLALALGSFGAVAMASMAHSTSHSHRGVAVSNHWMW